MKIVIAPDSFKENLTSMQVATCIEKGIKKVLPKAKCFKVPMADGGEGTVQSLVDATGGKIVRKKVTTPDGKQVTARYGLLGDGITGVIEMAEASGLHLVEKEKRDPLKATTFGTGELIADAMNKGIKTIIIGLGGSATNDGGAGMAQALGVRFLDSKGKEITQHLGGGMLKNIATIDMSQANPLIKKTKLIIASDVVNPLSGKKGASHVFGPQKGASPAQVKTLDDNLKYFGQLIKKQLKKDVASKPGAGAAGGLGTGLMAFTRSNMKRGVDLVVKMTDLEKYLKGADLVITGEGRVDFQTAFGKTPAGVAKAAKKHKVPVIAIGGALADDASGVFEHGIHGLDAAVSQPMPLEDALKNSKKYLELAGERVIRMLLVGKKMAKK
ncbi:MAG: glycerate kinase [Gammaproteobacteria bacterium]